jgi:hypothetical protein
VAKVKITPVPFFGDFDDDIPQEFKEINDSLFNVDSLISMAPPSSLLSSSTSLPSSLLPLSVDQGD